MATTAVAAPDTASDAFWYFGVYHLKTASPMAERLELQTLVVKKLKSPTAPLLVVFQNGKPFGEMNVPVSYDAAHSRFGFAADLEECQDYDCVGVDSASGYFARGKELFREELHVTFNFFEDRGDGKVTKTRENLTYIGDPSDGSFSH